MPTQWSQSRFDSTFISASEICKLLQVERSTVLFAKNRGLLPPPITTSTCDFWVREEVKTIIEDWKLSLNKRRRVS